MLRVFRNCLCDIFRIADYTKSEFAKDRKVCKKERLEEEKQIQKEMNKTVEIRELYAVSAKNAPFFKLFRKKYVFFCSC